MKLTGGDEAVVADVELIDGKPSIRTFGVQAIESLRGFDPICDVWFYIGTEEDSTGSGDIGDTVRIQIAADDDPSVFPAIDETYTLVSGDETSEETLSLNIANFLNTSTPFNQLWRAKRIAGNGVVYITARKPGGQYERLNSGDFQVTTTGTTTVTISDNKIVRRNKITGLARDPADDRQGQLGVQGSVTQSAGDVTNRFQTLFDSINVNGSGTPVNFTVSADPTEVKFISSVTIAGRDNGIQFSNFMGINNELSTGIIVSFKSNDITVVRAAVKSTDDLLDLHAEDPDNFVVFFASGEDKLTAELKFDPALELRPQNEFAVDDYITVTVNDNLTSVNQLRLIINGFNREF